MAVLHILGPNQRRLTYKDDGLEFELLQLRPMQPVAKLQEGRFLALQLPSSGCDSHDNLRREI